MSEPKFKHVRFDAELRKWVSAPFTYLLKTRHKPHGRRRMTRDAVRATAGGSEMSWKPLGKYALVRLHTQGSVLELTGDVQYNGQATVLAVGEDVTTLAEGDVVLLNGPAGIIAAKTLDAEVGPHTGLVAVPLVLARKERES